MAQEAVVKTLVLSHLVPPDDPEVTEQMWIDAARPHFAGEIIVGRDLLEIRHSADVERTPSLSADGLVNVSNEIRQPPTPWKTSVVLSALEARS